ELCHGGKWSERACGGETRHGGRRVGLSEPGEKSGKNPQEAAEDARGARGRKVGNCHWRGNGGRQRGAVFGPGAAPAERTVGLSGAVAADLGDHHATA